MTAPLELLAPARDAEVARVAILCGADAVYMGAPAFGARSNAVNSVADIGRTADFAHRYGCRIYVTMNTVLLDSELEDARRLVYELYDAGADALIVQDMAYLMLDLPPIALHASTQCDIRTPEKAAWLAGAGFSQLVLPREFTVGQVRAAAAASGLPVEVFIHGARCVSYSGDCQMAHAAGMGSGNRGTCPQLCRLPYELLDASGRPVRPAKGYYLSRADLSTDARTLRALADAGARSFKIEGRLKDRRYVANVTAHYSAMLDGIIAEAPELYGRPSCGLADPGFTPDPSQSFFRRPNGGGKDATLASPKDTGEPLGKAGALRRGFTLDVPLANGDGLGFFGPDGFVGFRLNKVEGKQCFPADPNLRIAPGTPLYRNFNKLFADRLDAAEPRRTLALTVDFAVCANTLTVKAHDETGRRVTVREALAEEPQQARSPQGEVRRNLFSKLGNTIYRLTEYCDNAPELFVPASVISRLKAGMLDALEEHACELTPLWRRSCSLAPDAFAAMAPLDYHANVTNRLSRKFYTDHGARVAEDGLEARKNIPEGPLRVMRTRYCIRGELGACLCGPDAAALPAQLYLRSGAGLYRVDADCAACEMSIIRLPKLGAR